VQAAEAPVVRERLEEYAEASRFIRIDEQTDVQDAGIAVVQYRGRTERI
jgi:hypothetical protein